MKTPNIFILVLIIIVAFFEEAKANTVTVCATCSIKTIHQAIDISSAGDTILVKGGHYKEGEIVINKPLTIIGINKPIIDAEFKTGAISIISDSVVVKDFIIQNIGLSYTEDFAAILISKSKYFTITGNTFKSVFFGILVEKSHYGTIHKNVISGEVKQEYNSGNGIHIWHCSNIQVTENNLSHLRDGIYFEFVNDSYISKNWSENNLRYGLHFMFSNHNDYYDNTFVNNGAGVAVMFSKFINMKRNRFYKNWGTASFGLLLKEIYDAEIEDNVFEENTVGINVEGSNRINYFNNDLIRNGWAVKFAGGCYANNFSNNNFLNNSFDISYNSKMNDNAFNDNYWSSYTGYDLDKDGVGDVPYRPVKLFSYIVNQTPETIVLLRSLFIDILNFSEKVSPVFTPDYLVDATPKMKIIND